MKIKNVLIGLAPAVLFSLLCVYGLFEGPENQVYDLFLRFRQNRKPVQDVTFLDADDEAIAYNGVFPWPRSVIADSLLRLKEYGARAAVFDIEFIDKGPQGVDAVYLNQGLPADFNRSFSVINSRTRELLDAIQANRVNRNDINRLSQALSGIVSDEQNNLFLKAKNIARDNDQYLIEASYLFGRSWVTLNLRAQPLSGEQAERRSMAEKRFSYPVMESPNAVRGQFADILPPLPGFALSAAGAGFTNAEVDRDGIRRRIDLAQNVQDHWYLQLAFSPLVDYLGNPSIELDRHRMHLKNAKMPNGITKDFKIPLDGKGRMLLDWPKTDFTYSYNHISFYDFSLMEELELELEQYTRALGDTDIGFFSEQEPSLAKIPLIVMDLEKLFDVIHPARADALKNCSDESFKTYVDCRRISRGLMREILNAGPELKVRALIPQLVELYPNNEDAIREEAEYISTLAEYIRINLDRYESINEKFEKMINDKFCILGRVDTGTTDIGSNPFYGEYVNVGTHGVIMDMVLSGSFISPLGIKWQAFIALVLTALFLLAGSRLSPVSRALSGFTLTAALIVLTVLLFRFTGLFFNPLTAVLSIISGIIISEIISYTESEREKQFIKKAFSTYVSDDVVKEIIADPSRLQLGGTKRNMTAIFTDVKGFSTISEKLDPERLVTLLNYYLSAMSDVVLEKKGTIDKFEGDAIIAFFGAPIELPDHALRACLSAITMKNIEKELNKKIMGEKLSPTPLLTRIGVNTGNMVAGNMGTGNKMNYTIMGNAVNLAARLEGVNKQYRTWILASDDTVRETQEKLLVRMLDRVRVVGINEPVRLYELINTVENSGQDEKTLVETFRQALDLYETRQWKEAAEGFRDALEIETRLALNPDGGPSAVYLERCGKFKAKPPADDWDGVHNLTEK
ncbi:MAG: adenylate/guanylate cyclase domain-containing protein [Treponema sp.]|jgi:adenylate cyclase|nr:adenylate/guanylate cyclase domain-containing protein [Treponema sp.]